MATHMLLTLTIYWVDASAGKKGEDCVTYDGNKGISAAEQAVENWEQTHPSQRVYGIAGLPISLLPSLPSPVRRQAPSRAA